MIWGILLLQIESCPERKEGMNTGWATPKISNTSYFNKSKIYFPLIFLQLLISLSISLILRTL